MNAADLPAPPGTIAQGLVRIGGAVETFAVERPRLFIWLLIALAGLRIGIYAAAFPFFNQVDETAHFDTIERYSRFELPSQELDLYNAETARMAALYATREYVDPNAPSAPPLWLEAPAVQANAIEAKRAIRVVSAEAHQPPVYYAIAGLWYRALALAHVPDTARLYLLRLINIPFYAGFLLVVASYLRRFHRDDAYLRTAVPLLLAFLPQDTFYGLSNDVAAPLFFVATMIVLERVGRGEEEAPTCLAGGLLAAATFLTKFTNFPVYLLVGVAAWSLARRRAANSRRAAGLIALLLISAFLPAVAWCVRSIHAFGSASGLYVMKYVWSPKPPAEWIHHPIFTPGGLFTFLKEVVVTTWRGELAWKGTVMAIPALDVFYVASTFVFIAAAGVGTIRNRDRDMRLHFSLWAVALLFLVSVSIRYDFGKSPYPSRAFPYFVSGRYFTGLFMSFAILYLTGVRALLGRFQLSKAGTSLLILALFLITVGEGWLSRPVFHSAYNLFHTSR